MIERVEPPDDRGNLKPDGVQTWDVDEPPSVEECDEPAAHNPQGNAD